MKPIFAARCGLESSARAAQAQAVLQRCRQEGIDTVRVAWCDLHGLMRGKALSLRALERAFDDGVGLVSTLLLKDTSDRTAYKVFEPGGTRSLPGFGQANNLVLLPDPASFRELPWTAGTGWLRGQPWFQDGTPVAIDTRRVLQRALEGLRAAGLGMVVFSKEGTAVEALLAGDIVTPDVLTALDMLDKPLRLIATLRK